MQRPQRSPPAARRFPARPLSGLAGAAGLLALLGAAPLAAPPALAGQSNEAGGQRVSGQVHRTIRRAGPGPLPRPVFGARIGASTAAVGGAGVSPVSGAFGPPTPPRAGIGGTGRAIGVVRGLSAGLVLHDPLLLGSRSGLGTLHRHRSPAGPAASEAVRATGVPYRPTATAEPALPPAAAGPREPCAVVSLRAAAGSDRSLRVAAGHLGASTVDEAEAILERRLSRGEPLVLRGWEGSGLILPAERVRSVSLTACRAPEAGPAGGESR